MDGLPYGWQKRSPKQVAAIVLLILMAMVLSFVELPVVPGAEWLKYDPSGIVSLLTTILYGSWIGVAVAVVSWIPHLVTDPLGAFMNIMATVSLIMVWAPCTAANPACCMRCWGALRAWWFPRRYPSA